MLYVDSSPYRVRQNRERDRERSPRLARVEMMGGKVLRGRCMKTPVRIRKDAARNASEGVIVIGWDMRTYTTRENEVSIDTDKKVFL